MRVALCQINTTVGDIVGNCAKVIESAALAAEGEADLVAFPELTLTGYPPEDLLLKRHFLEVTEQALDRLASELRDAPTLLVGFAERSAGKVYNSLAVLSGGRTTEVFRKMLLPNYGVFDERRYFVAGEHPAVVEVAGTKVGLTICEDIWEPHSEPLAGSQRGGAELIVNISASPYDRGKGLLRQQMLADRARDHGCHIALCSLVGGQDELVFDGQSMVVNGSGELVARAPQFKEHLMIVELGQAGPVSPALDPVDEVHAALQLGVRDYVAKNGFDRVVLGLSGGIDSALTACIAVDALGPNRVICVVMPSPHSSTETQDDARAMARRLGAELYELPIEAAMRAYERTLEAAFEGTEQGVAEENIQARIRGNLVMALSNKFGWLPLTTGNKSEYSVGYTTLYGDMAGGFAVLKDVPKMLVYDLARRRNEAPDAPIPPAIIERAPSAELRPGQLDEDSLPPYELLDQILEGYVEQDLGREALIKGGFDAATVDRVIALVDHTEYKRRQAPPGIKITPKSFGRDRRLPITNRFRG